MEQHRNYPLISVIIPVYNGERFLSGAIRNVLAQNYAPLEIIVVDDGSTDDTAAVAAQFGETICCVSQPRRGPAAARNRALNMAQGELIAFLDVDDLWPLGKLRHQAEFLASHPAVDIAQGLIVQMQLDQDAPGADMVFEECSEPYQFVNLGSVVVRSAVFARVGLFDEGLWENEDTDWFFRAWEKNVVKTVQDQVTLYYRRHTSNMTLEQRHPGLRIVKMFKRHIDRCRTQGLDPNVHLPGRPSSASFIGGAPATLYKERIRDERFTIISNDCWAAGPYGHASLMYRSPFIGLRILGPCYLELLKHLDKYMAAPLDFIGVSRYKFMNQRRAQFLGDYPIALLRGKVEVHFVHETDAATASEKWQRRKAKMNWDNLFIKFSQDIEVCSDAMLKDFDRLPYQYKVCFTLRDYPRLRSTVLMPEYFTEGAPMYFLSRRYFDTIGWLNKLHGPDTQAYRLAADKERRNDA